ncbi:MAG TPA: hypothetical protein VJ180_09605 [Pyrinomonadaceae bacterium]|nr:hypothetical protein [Pyrinomonadaceae bacterium]
MKTKIRQLYMASIDRQSTTKEDSRRKVIIGVAVISALIIGGLFYFLMRATGGGSPQPTLQGAVRPGTAEWDQYHSKIVLDPPEADEARRPLGDIVMTLRCTVRNFTGQPLRGLEMKGTVVDYEGNAVRERAVVVIPTERQPELGPNKTMTAVVVIEGFKESDNRANIRMDVSGFRF